MVIRQSWFEAVGAWAVLIPASFFFLIVPFYWWTWTLAIYVHRFVLVLIFTKAGIPWTVVILFCCSKRCLWKWVGLTWIQSLEPIWLHQSFCPTWRPFRWSWFKVQPSLSVIIFLSFFSQSHLLWLAVTMQQRLYCFSSLSLWSSRLESYWYQFQLESFQLMICQEQVFGCFCFQEDHFPEGAPVSFVPQFKLSFIPAVFIFSYII